MNFRLLINQLGGLGASFSESPRSGLGDHDLAKRSASPNYLLYRMDFEEIMDISPAGAAYVLDIDHLEIRKSDR